MNTADFSIIAISSTNPIKIEAVKEGFTSMIGNAQFKSFQVESGVSNQPMTSDDTLAGAINRANNCKSIVEADYYVGIEGGVEFDNTNELRAFAWVVIINNKDFISKAKSGDFMLPKKIAELILSGKELGEADDIVFNQVNSKQNLGAVGILTKGLIDRKELYSHAMKLALIPFINPEFYLN